MDCEFKDPGSLLCKGWDVQLLSASSEPFYAHKDKLCAASRVLATYLDANPALDAWDRPIIQTQTPSAEIAILLDFVYHRYLGKFILLQFDESKRKIEFATGMLQVAARFDVSDIYPTAIDIISHELGSSILTPVFNSQNPSGRDENSQQIRSKIDQCLQVLGIAQAHSPQLQPLAQLVEQHLDSFLQNLVWKYPDETQKLYLVQRITQLSQQGCLEPQLSTRLARAFLTSWVAQNCVEPLLSLAPANLKCVLDISVALLAVIDRCKADGEVWKAGQALCGWLGQPCRSSLFQNLSEVVCTNCGCLAGARHLGWCPAVNSASTLSQSTLSSLLSQQSQEAREKRTRIQNAVIFSNYQGQIMQTLVALSDRSLLDEFFAE